MSIVLDFENTYFVLPQMVVKLVAGKSPWPSHDGYFPAMAMMTLEAVFYVGILWLSHHQQMAGTYPSWLVLTKYYRDLVLRI